MTEFYSFWDSHLVQEVLDADVQRDSEALDQILAADHLAGQKGEEILSRNCKFGRITERKRGKSISALNLRVRPIDD